MEKVVKFYFSELLLTLYVLSLITLNASELYMKYDNLMALLFVVGCMLELLARGKIRVEGLRFIVPLIAFAGFSTLTLLFNHKFL